MRTELSDSDRDRDRKLIERDTDKEIEAEIMKGAELETELDKGR